MFYNGTIHVSSCKGISDNLQPYTACYKINLGRIDLGLHAGATSEPGYFQHAISLYR